MRIVFVGKSKSGRSACGLYLYRKHHFKRMGLEDGNREIIRKFYFHKQIRKIRWNERMRMYDALYKLDSNIFIDYLMRRIGQTTPGKRIVCDDVRYINELRILQENGFTIVRIVAPENRRQQFIPTINHAAPGSVILHEWFNVDKTDIIKADYVILNNNRADTQRSLDRLVAELEEKERNLTINET